MQLSLNIQWQAMGAIAQSQCCAVWASNVIQRFSVYEGNGFVDRRGQLKAPCPMFDEVTIRVARRLWGGVQLGNCFVSWVRTRGLVAYNSLV
jgi:hypothetical protein